ncbi:MAG: hypothetical protein P8X52_07720, partial [Limibacillus sp.]
DWEDARDVALSDAEVTYAAPFIEGEGMLVHEERVSGAGLRGILHPGVVIGADGDQLDQLLINVVTNAVDAALETGGGAKKALPLLGAEPFFLINGDVLWLNGLRSALSRMATKWDAEAMDLLLLLHPTAYAIGYNGPGDFMMDQLGRLLRRRERQVSPFVFAGVQIVKPEVFENTPDGPFSMNVIFDRAQEAERLYGLRHDGEWFHIGTPPDLKRAEAQLHHMEFHTVQR